MKKKIFRLLLTTVMVLTVTACGGGGNSHMQVTINDKKYDLSDDFQKVVGNIAEDDVHVVNIDGRSEFDEDGYIVKIDDFRKLADESRIAASERKRPCMFNNKTVDGLIYQYYELSTGNIEYKTADGITDDSKADDAEELKGYVELLGYMNPKNECYAGFYVDGKLVDLDEYSEDFEELLDDIEAGEDVNEIIKDKFNGLSTIGVTRMALGELPYVLFERQKAMDSDNMSDFEEQYPFFENEILLSFAFMDANEQLIDGDIDSYTLIAYECFEKSGKDEMWTYYHNYYMDENYDDKKFRGE